MLHKGFLLLNFYFFFITSELYSFYAFKVYEVLKNRRNAYFSYKD